MTISETIKILEEFKEAEGDLQVAVLSQISGLYKSCIKSSRQFFMAHLIER